MSNAKRFRYPVITSVTDPKAKSVPLRDLLTGVCSLQTLQGCQIKNLENLLLKVIRMHSVTDPEELTRLEVRPPWWPDHVLPFEEVHHVRNQVHEVMVTWHSTLATILDSCVKYYDQHGSRTPPIRSSSMIHPRTSQDSAGASTTSTWSSKAPLTPKRFNVTEDTLDITMSPKVIVKDVLKSRYPVLDKGDYMNFLNLQAADLPAPNALIKSIPKLKKYPCKIPLSSVYGKTLIQSERFNLSKTVYERKRDWTNIYLAPDETSTSQNVDFNVTYKPRPRVHFDHMYKFPLRQIRQRRNATRTLQTAFCRRVTVKLQRFNIEPYLEKKNVRRRLSICVSKKKTDEFYEEFYKNDIESGSHSTFTNVMKF